MNKIQVTDQFRKWNKVGTLLQPWVLNANGIPMIVHLNLKWLNMQNFIISARKDYDYPLSAIGNMDETPMTFDLPGNRTVEVKGCKNGVCSYLWRGKTTVYSSTVMFSWRNKTKTHVHI